jgi:hypothetical protein
VCKNDVFIAEICIRKMCIRRILLFSSLYKCGKRECCHYFKSGVLAAERCLRPMCFFTIEACIRKYCLLFRSVFRDDVVLTGEILIRRMFSLLYAPY